MDDQTLEEQFGVSLIAKEDLTKEQFNSIQNVYAISRASSNYFKSEYSEKAKKAGKSMEEFFTNVFNKRVNAGPNMYACVAYPKGKPDLFIAYIFLRKISDKSVYLSGVSVLPEYQNKRLIPHMIKFLYPYFSAYTVWGAVHRGNEDTQTRMGNLSAQESLLDDDMRKTLTHPHKYNVLVFHRPSPGQKSKL